MLAFNDQCAIGFLQTVRDAGLRVPGDLSLVGYDDSRLAHASWTRLTTVGQDTAALAEGPWRGRSPASAPPIAAPADPPDEALLVPPSLVIRSTNGTPGRH